MKARATEQQVRVVTANVVRTISVTEFKRTYGDSMRDEELEALFSGDRVAFDWRTGTATAEKVAA